MDTLFAHVFREVIATGAAMLWLFILPGALLVRVVAPSSIGAIGTALLALPVGSGIMDVLMLLGSALALPLNRIFILTAPALIVIPAILILLRRQRGARRITIPYGNAILAAAAITIAIKGTFVAMTVFPTATDMGHHLYWVQKIVASGTIPPYEKQQIVPTGDGYALREPMPIPDFIIGEHLPIAALLIATGSAILGAMPPLFLFALDLTATALLALLTWHLAPRVLRAYAALSALVLGGALYTISGAQAKFITGGVIGNLFGNMFIAATLFVLLRAALRRDGRAFALGAFLIGILVYTHHLSTLMLGYALGGIVTLFFILHARHIRDVTYTLLRMACHPLAIAVYALFALLLIVHVPSYLTPEAIGSATGAPSKATRTGLSFAQMRDAIGTARIALAFVGLGVIAGSILRRRATHTPAATTPLPQYTRAAILIGWSGIALTATLAPQLLGINIISTRVGNYTALPVIIAGSIGMAWLFAVYRTIPVRAVRYSAIGALLFFTVSAGMADNASALRRTTPDITPAKETYAAARYLARHAQTDAWTIKDHNYLTADTWMKLFFLRDYSYPLSRSYFKRYENARRERCTLDMISAPNSAHAQRCMRDLNVRYFVISPQHDAPSFMRTTPFARIYDSAHVTIFAR